MHLDFLDRQAATGQSPMHRASTLAKLLLVATVVAGMLTGSGPAYYAATGALLLALAALARLPMAQLLELLLYPALFAAVLAWSGLAPGGSGRWLVVARAATTALAVLLLFGTTVYAEVFAALRLILPGLLGDVLLLTYRSFFILLRELRRTLVALRLKGSGRPAALAQNVRAAGAALGLTALHALEMAERMHRILALRGYRGVIPTGRPWWRPSPWDALPLGAAVLVAVLAWLLH